MLQLFLLLPSIVFAQTKPVYKNLVFEGGGIRGVAYAGVIKALEEKNLIQPVEKTAGSSVGAIAALLVSLQYSSHEIDSVFSTLSIEEFNDGKWMFAGGISRLKKNYGWYRGNKFENWIKNIIVHKTGNGALTFQQLHELTQTNKLYKDFYCTGTNLTKQKAEVFSWQSTPGMQLSTAVRISISIPLYFGAVFLNDENEIVKPSKSNSYNVYVDGGLLSNYPLTIFDSCYSKNENICDSLQPNFETLGIKLDRPEQIEYDSLGNNDLAGYDIRTFSSYINSLYNLLFETVNKQHKDAAEKQRTVYISTSGISPRIRKMKTSEKEILLQNGYSSTLNFLQANNLADH